MSNFKIEDFRFSSSSIDDFFSPDQTSESRTASSGKIRVASLGQIRAAGFSFVADDRLVRLSQKDFWELDEDEDGPFIRRLVSDDEGPVKV